MPHQPKLLEVPATIYRVSLITQSGNVAKISSSPSWEGAKLKALNYITKRKLGIVQRVEEEYLLYLLTAYYKDSRYTIIVHKEN